MKKTRWINFLGGNNLLFTLVAAILMALLIMLYNQVSFFFHPLFVIVSNIIAPAILALLLYYLFNPLINLLERRGLKRNYAVILLYVLIILLLIVVIGSLYPLLAKQITDFINDFPAFYNSVIMSIRSFSSNLPFSNSIEGFIDQGQKFIRNLPTHTQEYLTEGFTGLSRVVTSLSNVIVTIVIAPVFLFFLLKDDRKFFNGFLNFTPPKWRGDLIEVSTEINQQVSAYVKGQLIVATALAVMAYTGFAIIGLEYKGVLAIITGFTSIVPYLGTFLAFSAALIIAVSTSWWMVAKLLIVWMVVQFLDGNVIQPNVMGKQLDIHPLTIIIVLLVAGDLLGLVGLILGVPLYAIIRVLLHFGFNQFKKRYNRYYGDEAGVYEIEDTQKMK